jgi:uncharacterized protein (TIGR03435 family)
VAEAEGSTLLEFSKLISLAMDRPVVDKTGLTERFDIHMEFAADGATPKVGGAADGPSIFTAIQEQLGLKLVAAKGPVESLVIDSVERPSGN